ncbi:MAG: AMP-binding protein [Sphingomonadaceae bacterium]|nr:AMP-binding protein [Sphingomonadaceae bacterium]
MANSFHLADLFESVAATAPDRLALICGDARLTYAALNARADALASGLAARGISRGDHIGLYLQNGPAFLESFIAAVKLGAVPFNVNYRYGADELRHLFADADAACIIHGAQYGSLLDSIRGDLPKLRLTVAVADGSGAACPLSADYAALSAHAPTGPWPRDADDILLSYTGGTTGLPKGVMWPHKAFVFACAGGAGYFNPHGVLVEPGDIVSRVADAYPLKIFPLAPLMHMAAMWTTWSALLNGLTIILDDGAHFDAVRVFDTVEREAVNLIQFVGDAMAIPLRDTLIANPGRWNLATIVNLGSGGAVFSAALKEDLKNLIPTASITDGMGASETGVSGMAAPSKDGVMRLPAHDGQKVVVDGRFAAVGEMGYIATSGHTPIGYYGDAQKSAETFQTVEGRLWVVSGDAGRLDDDGMITMFGRGSTSINSGGEKIFPEEVEEVLRTHDAIYDAVVVGVPDPRWGEQVVALVSLCPGAVAPDLAQLRDAVAGSLAGYKMPRRLIIVDQVLRSPAGKQDYRWAKGLALAAGGTA